jgi:hypothetical protein
MKTLAAVLVTAFVTIAAAQGAALPTRGASVSASTYKAGAKPVALTFKLDYEMPCGNPGQTLAVQLPSNMGVPASISPGSVLVNGKTAKSVSRHGSTLSIAIAEKHWLRCNVLGFGSLSVVIGAKAGLANPRTPGVYGFRIAVGTVHGTPKLRIS